MQLNIYDEAYIAFKRQTTRYEGRYNAINPRSGYLGAYQMGEGLLQDIGYFRGDGNPNGYQNFGGVGGAQDLRNPSPFWLGKHNVRSIGNYLAFHLTQDKACDLGMIVMWTRIQSLLYTTDRNGVSTARTYPLNGQFDPRSREAQLGIPYPAGRAIIGSERLDARGGTFRVTPAGVLAAAWLGGQGGARDFIMYGIDYNDRPPAAGTWVTDRLRNFSGYNLPLLPDTECDELVVPWRSDPILVPRQNPPGHQVQPAMWCFLETVLDGRVHQQIEEIDAFGRGTRTLDLGHQWVNNYVDNRDGSTFVQGTERTLRGRGNAPNTQNRQPVYSPLVGRIAVLNQEDGEVVILDNQGRWVRIWHIEFAAGLTEGQDVGLNTRLGQLSDVAYPVIDYVLEFEVGDTPGREAIDPVQSQWMFNWRNAYGICWNSQPAYNDWATAATAGFVAPDDPLVLDLDGDGIRTISITAGTYFDQNGDGFAEMTGWVSADDGLLVMDRNSDGVINDGRELFGNQMITASGHRAANGFEALAELDDNHDGKIDANDAAFSQIRVWKDAYEDGRTEDGELYTLEELGITAINLNSTPSSVTDPQSNTQNRVGSFEKADGTTGTIADYSFQQNPMYAIANEVLDVPDDIAGFPNLTGRGMVRDLHQAMVRDTSGQLKSLLEQFFYATATETFRRRREAL